MDLKLIGLLALILFAAIAILKKPVRGSKISYRISGPLFSPAERSFLGVLMQAIPTNNLVMGKVRVADIITPEKGLTRSDWQSAFNKISSKHFDYVICDRSTLKVISVIELNDKSHKKKKRADRDVFLREACISAGLRFLEFEAKANYSVNEVSQMLADGH